jgi:NADPH2:quinone reductase
LKLPALLGVQGAGVVEEVGAGVTDLAIGQRVGYVGQPGAYTEWRVLPADRVIALPDAISSELAAAAMLRGLTCEYLLRRLYRVEPGQTILFHAAAGGLGLIACQWAKALGATVIGTVGSDEKAELARQHGCDYPVVYTREDFVGRVQDITGGRGVSVVYDSVGKDTFLRSLDCLMPRGTAVNFGTASGQVPDFPLQLLHKKSLFVTRPTLPVWIADRREYVDAAEAFFSAVTDGTIRVSVGKRYAFDEIIEAHRDLEGRRPIGLQVLVP